MKKSIWKFATRFLANVLKSNNMSYHAVFLLKSPLQLLNALEACQHFGIARRECVLVLMADHKSLPQMLSLVKKTSGWGGTVSLVNVGLDPSIQESDGLSHERHAIWGNDAFGIIKLKNLARRLGRLDYVFLGDLGNLMMRHFANLADVSEVVALDDGTATLQYAVWRNQGRWGRKQRLSKKAGLWLKRIALGLRDNLPGRLTFFSAYEIEVPPQDLVVKNTFMDLRAQAGDMPLEESVFFLGGPLVEASILSEEEYLWHLERVARYFSNRKVTYVAHRRENWERVKRIGRALGWDVRLFDYPIEFQLAVVGPRPRILAAFFSSALENCRAIFGDMLTIYAFTLSDDQFARKAERGESVKNVYDRYARLSGEFFHVVDIHNTLEPIA
ncbi:MAG: hypothetical protein SCI25_00895 [Desulfuromonadales bacterium]|nr:hypothetical protein [Desulfuromonadales bacterium]MDW7756470.1 hypothetical protein [Desulfuromonadales bacterium]